MAVIPAPAQAECSGWTCQLALTFPARTISRLRVTMIDDRWSIAELRIVISRTGMAASRDMLTLLTALPR
jgi:hypothetical protein